MTKTTLLALAALALLLATPVGSAGKSAGERPFRATFQGHTTSVVYADPGNPLATSTFAGRCPVASNWMIFFTGTGEATHLGRLTWTSSHCTRVDAFPPTVITISGGQVDFVAANGDRLLEAYAGGEVTVATPTLMCIDTHVTFNGGTGRFEHASGTALEHGCWNPSNEPNQPALNDLRVTSTGTIAYNASDRAG